LTILKRRDGYHRAFADWDCHQVAEFGPEKIEQLLQDPGIIRNRRKIESAIRNAAVFLQIQQEVGSFSDYIR
jgi:3-methyladenine DNA glycosylase Tag